MPRSLSVNLLAPLFTKFPTAAAITLRRRPLLFNSYSTFSFVPQRLSSGIILGTMSASTSAHRPRPEAAHRNKKRRLIPKKQKVKAPGTGSTEEVLEKDVQNLLDRVRGPRDEGVAEKDKNVEGSAEIIPTKLPDVFSVVQARVQEIGGSGDGLAFLPSKDHIYVVPFTVPGDVVEAKIYKHFEDYSLCDFIKVIEPGPLRDDSLIKCPYFASCGGCQFQMLPYEHQLKHKQGVIEHAYEHFSGLNPAAVPEIGPTWASPLQYGYRTKLTPHFDGPRGNRGRDEHAEIPPIGFQKKGQRYVIDIEECPIGTPVLNEGLVKQRQWVKENIRTYKRGATLLLRESTNRKPVERDEGEDTAGMPGYVEEKTCVVDNNATIVEWVGKYKLESPAGTFFQNNNSILEEFTSFVRECLFIPATGESSPPQINYLVDAYCGSGLFSITLGQSFTKVIGVDVAKESILFATKNALNNNMKNTQFVAGNAEAIFASIDFAGEETAVIIDPPRKGSDKAFLDQLLELAPKRIVYVSCNVHTQARDLGYLLQEERAAGYRIDSIRGFDFFPQTYHVESIAVLTRAV